MRTERRDLVPERECDLPVSSGAPAGAGLAWTLTCACCGASWAVTPLIILSGADWTRCPRCPRHSSEDLASRG